LKKLNYTIIKKGAKSTKGEKNMSKQVETMRQLYIETMLKNQCKSVNFELVMTNYEIENDCEFITIELVNKKYTCDSYISVQVENKKVELFEVFEFNDNDLQGKYKKDMLKEYYSSMIELDKIIDFITE
jgi:hypothetical protein